MLKVFLITFIFLLELNMFEADKRNSKIMYSIPGHNSKPVWYRVNLLGKTSMETRPNTYKKSLHLPESHQI